MRLSLSWADIQYAALALLAGLVLGLITGYWALSIGAVLFFNIIRLLSKLARIREWLIKGLMPEAMPNIPGSAGDLVKAIVAVKRDSDRQRKRLEELLNRFDAATDAMPDAMLIIDRQNLVEWANPAAKQLLGIDPQRDIGQPVGNIVRDPVIAHYLQMADYSEPLEFSSPGSTERDLMLKIIPYSHQRHLFYVQDHKDLLRLERVRKSFVTNASHEMRTPLTVIIGYLEALSEQEEMDSRVRSGVDGALDQSLRLKNLLEDLLALSKLESTLSSQSAVEPIDMVALLKETIELVEASSHYKDQPLSLRCEAEVKLIGNRTELQSVIRNIVDNAVKYTEPQTPIDIVWKQLADGSAKLGVQDHGEGIAARHLPHITERFYRVDKGRSRDTGGTGLGLSIVKHVVERHAGRLHINSELGVGTYVEMVFPQEQCEELSNEL